MEDFFSELEDGFRKYLKEQNIEVKPEDVDKVFEMLRDGMGLAKPVQHNVNLSGWRPSRRRSGHRF